MKRAAIGILAISAITTAHADPLYISDKLVVNVYAEADQESSKVATLDSGDAVESIEKVDAYTRVRLADDREGWIKSSYLTAQVPAVVRLKELEKEHGAGATAAATQLNNELKQVKEQNAALQTELAAAKQVAPSIAPAAVVALPQQNSAATALTPRDPQAPNQPPNQIRHLSWLAALALSGGIIGFALGYQTLARRIRRKYGSVRIY